ncbi:MAG: hypothetical protein CM15mP77_3270 [Synechococcus sp.]|nr:MAG: hypothetical protein CM15mP77_3270 [Synechococcus sp.]
MFSRPAPPSQVQGSSCPGWDSPLLPACSGDAGARLSGITSKLCRARNLREVIDLLRSRKPREAEGGPGAYQRYMSRHRPQPRVNGLSSFTTMQTPRTPPRPLRLFANRPFRRVTTASPGLGKGEIRPRR